MRPPPEQQYKLGYRWLIEGPIETVFHYVGDANTFPEWWPQFRSAETEPKTPQVGGRMRALVKSFLPYDLTWDCVITRYEPPRLIEVESHVSLGRRFRLSGWVRFTLREWDGLVEVLNEQVMVPERSVPRLLRPLAQRLFSWNHNFAMK